MSKVLDELVYTRDDEWVRVEGDEATVGITDYAQDSLSDIVYLELPDEGEQFQQGEAFGVVESVKAAADLYMPVGGEVIAVNEALLGEPEQINEDPYGQGWMIRIRIQEKDQIQELMDAQAYQGYIEEREG